MNKFWAGLAKRYAARADAMQAALAAYGSGIDCTHWPDVILVNSPGKVVYLRERAEWAAGKAAEARELGA